MILLIAGYKYITDMLFTNIIWWYRSFRCHVTGKEWRYVVIAIFAYLNNNTSHFEAFVICGYDRRIRTCWFRRPRTNGLDKEKVIEKRIRVRKGGIRNSEYIKQVISISCHMKTTTMMLLCYICLSQQWYRLYRNCHPL